MGTGFNICYTENDVTRMEKWTEERKAKYADVKKVMIDIECGAFGDNGSIDFIKSDVDFEIDSQSLFPKSFS
jgi:hexokinase